VTGQATNQLTDQVKELIKRLILMTYQAYSFQKLMEILQLKYNANFRENYLNPAIEEGYVLIPLDRKRKTSKNQIRIICVVKTNERPLESSIEKN
jgi:hypothetical protein